MKLLAIETSGRQGSLSAWQAGAPGEGLIQEVRLPDHLRSAQSLAGCLKKLLEAAEWEAADIDAVAVASGPGSFTGLRIGVTTAKMLAFVAQCGVVEVSTLSVLADQGVLANQAGPGDGAVWAVMDAQRGEVFTACYQPNTPEPPVDLLTIPTFLSRLTPSDRVIGPIASKLTLPAGTTATPEATWQPLSSTVAKLAAPAALAGQVITPEELVPRYHRLSAAEEKRLKAQNGS